MNLRKDSIRATLQAVKLLPQDGVVRETIEKTEIMINIGKRRKYEYMWEKR